jgi:hypothetical protein
MKPLAVPPDAERVSIDYLTAALAARGVAATVGVDIPTTWAAASTQHLQVALDGTPSLEYPILARATVRLTAWASTTTAAKSLVSLAQGLMCAHPGDASVGSVQALTGVLPTRDPVSGAQLASVTVRVNLRMAVLA